MNMKNHGEMMTSEEKDILIRPPELSSNPTSSHLVASGGMDERNKNLDFQNISVHNCKWFLHAVKSYDMGPPALLSLRKKVC
jgi:hypothetical protein